MHAIRLHGPWTAEVAGTATSGARRVHLPRDWLELANLARSSTVRLLRRFHRPTGLADSTQVRLAIPAGWPVSSLRVNGVQVLPHSTVEERVLFELSSVIRMRESHDLEIEFRAGQLLDEQPYFVAIEIEELA